MKKSNLILEILKNIYLYIKYSVYLLCSIYISGFGMIKNIVSKKTPYINIFSLKIDIKNDIDCVIIANSITLTPGTITLEKHNNVITVLCLNSETRNLHNAKKNIMGTFENILIQKEGLK